MPGENDNSNSSVTTNPFTDYVNRLFQIESGGNPNAVTGSNRGLGQFGPHEEAMFGINDANRNSPMAQAAAVAAEHARNQRVLTQALGREPTFAEHYFTHQQGIAGGPALLTADPSMPAWKVIRPFYKSDAVAQRAITGNIGRDSPLKKLDVNDISAGGFTSYWRDKFNSGLPGVGGAPLGNAAGTPVPVAPAGAGFSPAGAPPSAIPAGLPTGNVAMAAPPTSAAAAPAAPAAAPSTFDDAINALFGKKDATKDTGSQLSALGQQLLKASAGPQPLKPMQFAPMMPTPRLPPVDLAQHFAAMRGQQIPQLAEGGVVTEPTVAMIGERGPEAVVPLQGLLGGSQGLQEGSEGAAAMTHQPERPPDMIGEVGRRMGNIILSPITAPFRGLGYLRDLTNRAMGGEDISVDPEAGGKMLMGLQALGGVSAPLARAPGGASLRAVLGPELYRESRKRLGVASAEEQGYEFTHNLLDPKTGQKVGTMSAQRMPSPRDPAEGDILYVNGLYGHSGPGQEGIRGTKELLQSIKEQYPWAVGISGYRVSGGRGAAAAENEATHYFRGPRFDKAQLAEQRKLAMRNQPEAMPTPAVGTPGHDALMRDLERALGAPASQPSALLPRGVEDAIAAASAAFRARPPLGGSAPVERLPRGIEGTFAQRQARRDAESARFRQRLDEIRASVPLRAAPPAGMTIHEHAALDAVARALGLQ